MSPSVQRERIRRRAPVNLCDAHREHFAPHLDCVVTPPQLARLGPAWFLSASQTLFSPLGKIFAPSASYPEELPLLTRRYFWLRRFLQTRQKLNGTALVLTDRFANNYYHWHAENLPSLIAFLGLPEARQSFTLLLPANCAKLAYVRESLAFFIDPKCIVVADSRQNFYAPAFVHCARSQPLGSPTPELLAEVAKRIRAAVPAAGNNSPGRKIYLKRSGAAAQKRSVLNEVELVEMLGARGYECLDFEGMPYAEQIATCQQAAVLMSIHGAGLANLLFMPRGSAVFEFKSLSDLGNESQCFFAMADACGHRFFYQACESTPSRGPGYAEDDHMGHLRVDLAMLKADLERYGL